MSAVATDTAEIPGHMPALRLMRAGLHVLFYALLVIGLLGSGPAGWILGALLGLVYAAGGWIERASRGRTGTPIPLLWLGVITVLWLGLALISANAAWVVFPLYFLYMHLLRPVFAVLAVLALTGATIACQASTVGGLTQAKIIGPCAGAFVAGLTAYGYAALYRESRKRQGLIEDLMRTRGELDESQREAGRLAERARLAREIHDTLAQGFSSIVLLAHAAQSALPQGSDSGAAAERIREIGETASANLAEARSFVAALTPPALQGSTLAEALRRLAASGDLNTEFRLDGQPYALPMESEVALLRLTQEALANVRRHARAGRAAVTLAYLDDEVTLDVYDDGVGFHPAAALRDEPGRTAGPSVPGDRFGLHGMRERIARLGGRFVVESAPGEGTVVAVSIPVSAAVAETAPEVRTA